MRNGMNEVGRRSRTTWAVVAAALLVSGVLVVGAQSSSAATNKTFNASCKGADAESQGLLGVISPSGVIEAPFNSSVDAPAFVTPGQTDVPVTITYSLNLPVDLVNKAVAFTNSISVANAKADVTITGPTSTTLIPGAFPDQTITLVKDQPLVSAFPPISGKLNDVGQGGIIKLTSQVVTFTMSLTVAGKPQIVNLTCATGVTLASVPVKVAGSPDIKQPIEVGPSASPITVDVLGQYVTNGTDKSGTVRPVDPSTLKVIEGPGTIQAGKVVVTPPATGQADVTFEVCAGTVEVAPATEGVSEVQQIRLFNEFANYGKREVATIFGLGDGQSNPLWHVEPFFGLGTGPIPQPWPDNILPYAFLDHSWPSAAEMKAALESIPGIGAGNVEVTADTPPKALEGTAYSYLDYTITFTGARANSEMEQIGVDYMASIFPREWLDAITAAAQELIPEGGGGGGGGGGEDVKQQLADLGAQIDAANAAGDFVLALTLFNEYVTLAFSNLSDLIDIQEVLGFLTSLFQKPAETSTVTQGENPAPAQMQELCSQGIITVKGVSVAAATTTSVPANNAAVKNTGQSGGTGLGIAG